MTRNEQLEFCRICKNQKFDSKQGIICGLTGSQAEFEILCDSFIEDSKLKIKNELRLKENEILNKSASQGKRFVNYILDLLSLYIFSYIYGIVLGIIIAIIDPELLSIFEEGNLLLQYFIGFVFAMIYFTSFEAATGRTLAKFITKTKVVDKNGKKPGFNTILIRSLCRFIPFEAFSFLGSEASGWHDTLSDTRVINS